MAPTVPIEFSGQKESKRCSASRLMGKSKKFSSKGLSAGFVPDFRHAVGTMAESEGFGSSGRVDTETTASDDSSAPTRKCISLNADGSDNFGIPLQVLSLAKMPGPERKELKMRLRRELALIENLQLRIASFTSQVIGQSPCSDIHSLSDGQKRLHLESSDVSARNGTAKKRSVTSHKASRSSKKVSSRHPEYAKLAAPAGASSSAWLKQCETLLKRLMTYNFSWVFNSPVDIVKLNIPDYFNVIKHPMDLGTVKSKLLGGEYSSPLGFATDVRLTFSNAMTYNPRGNDVHYMADTLNKNFETRWKSLEKKFNVADVMDSVPAHPANSGTRIEHKMPPLKKKKDMPVIDDRLTKPLLEKETMSDKEKHKLSMELESLLGELPDMILDFLKEQSSGGEQTSEDEIEIDIDALGDDTLFKLRRLLDDYLLEKQNTRTRSEPCEPKLHNESGISNSLLPLGRGNNAIDEEVDIIGGTAPPLSSFSPVEIEKDAAHRNDKCSSSSSSGSESGSESDSGGSAGEANVAEVSRPIVCAEEEFPHETCEDVRDPLVDVNHEYANQGPDVENSQPNSWSVDVPFEEENAQSERQVSPDKLYRAALMRSRFADTILKAREKALEKGEKQDPEKLRIEKEELERKAKEEKARIQAEAKAAEEARKRAEAKVAAEAKRKRELEREFARQALQKMEKTVNINENSEFMEDLEMLRVTQGDEEPNILEEASPEISENHLGSFKLRGDGNPLEQLGLYMKMDYEDEEEEGEPSRNMYMDVQVKEVLEEGERSQNIELEMRSRDVEEEDKEHSESIEVGITQSKDVEEGLEEREDSDKGVEETKSVVEEETKDVDGDTEERKDVGQG